MPPKPTSATARDTVLMCPPPAWLNCTVLTSRSSLLVSATSLRISLESVVRLSLSDCVMRWMRATESAIAGKSLRWRMRRSRNSSVALPPSPASGASPAGCSQAASASWKALASDQRCADSRARPRSSTARSASSLSGPRSAGGSRVCSIARRTARHGSGS